MYSVYGGVGNKNFFTTDSFYLDKVQEYKKLTQNDIDNYIKDYIKKIENGETIESKVGQPLLFDKYYDNLIEEERIYYFKSINGETIATKTPIPQNQSVKTFKELVRQVEETSIIKIQENKYKEFLNQEAKIIESKSFTSDKTTKIIKLNAFNWLFPVCTYCNKRHARYLFKLCYNDFYICKRCSWVYDINSVEKFKIVDEIRNEVKKNINL